MRTPDKSAPRYREECHTFFTNEFRDAFREKYPEHKDITLKELREIVTTFNEEMVDVMINNRSGVELPDGLGYVFMASCDRPRVENINFAKSQELGTKVQYTNTQSDNKLLKIFYSNYSTRHSFQHKQAWFFKAGRETKIKASQAFAQDSSRYADASPNRKISKLFDQHKRREYIRELKPIIPENYDEFKL